MCDSFQLISIHIIASRENTQDPGKGNQDIEIIERESEQEREREKEYAKV